MNEMILRGIYQVMVDILNEMKRLNNTLERSEINGTQTYTENRPEYTETNNNVTVRG